MSFSTRALLFDFDGLILDTETPEFGIWQRIYAEYGFDYPIDLGSQNIGRWGNTAFDPVGHLHHLTHDSLDREAIRKRHYDESAVAIARQPIGDGVEEYLSAARRLGLKLAVASSSPRRWVESHLTRLGLLRRFDRIVTSDDVPADRVKPHPDIYLKALDALGVQAAQAVAFEDSPPGVAAARAAGLSVVAIPNPITARLDLGKASLVIQSLRALPLEELLHRAP